MFNIDFGENDEIVVSGRLDAASAATAQEFLDQAADHETINMSQLEYISSAGLGVLLKTHKRLMGHGKGLKLTSVNSHISDIFHYSGFDKLFTISHSEQE